MLLRSLLMAVALMVTGVAQATPETPEEFVTVFQSGTQLEQLKAAQVLEWMGISSPQLFDLVEADLLKALPQSKDREIGNYVAYLTKGLSYSGNEKYRATIEKVIAETPNSRVKKHAIRSLPKLSEHTRLNPLIAPQSWPTAEHPSLNQRLANMLKSNDTDLIRLAAKRMHNGQNYSPELLALLNTTIEQNYLQPLGGERLDAIAWACRALASSQTSEYWATIEKVAADAPTKKLRSYAKKYINQYDS